MIYRGPGFLAVVLFGSSPTPFDPLPVSKLSLFLSISVCRRRLSYGGKGVGDEQNHKTARSLALYKSTNTLWNTLSPPHSPPDRRKTEELTSQTGVCLFTPPANDANYGKSAKSRNYFQIFLFVLSGQLKESTEGRDDTTDEVFLL